MPGVADADWVVRITKIALCTLGSTKNIQAERFLWFPGYIQRE